MVINISVKSGFGAGLLLGVLLGIALASMWLHPTPPCPDADAQPKGSDAERDEWRQATERDGVDRKATGTHGR